MSPRVPVPALTAAVAAAGLLALASAAGPASAANSRPVTTPLADPQLFISPCGEPFRSKPGEPYPVVAWFRQSDTNHDGRLDLAEFRAECVRFFHLLDPNGAGVIGDAQIGAYEHQLAPEILADPNTISRLERRRGGARLILAQTEIPPPVDPGGDANGEDARPPKQGEDDGPLQGAAPYGFFNDPEPLRSADRSLSGRVSLKDFLAKCDRSFQALDTRGRGYLTLDDLPTTPVERVARAGKG